MVALLTAFPSVARANVTEENFVLDTTRDLVALCGVDAADPPVVRAVAYRNFADLRERPCTSLMCEADAGSACWDPGEATKKDLG